MEFVAIDFETANESRISACELGLAVVRDGEVAEKRSWLIRPPELRFSPYNTYIHGISARDVAGEPGFDEIWPELNEILDGRLVFAHNASFDFSVLRNTLLHYELPFPDLHYGCTVMIARKAWPGLPAYKLNALAAYHSISLDHHRALSDAVACAEIAQRAMDNFSITCLDEIEEKFAIRLGRIHSCGYSPSSVRKY